MSQKLQTSFRLRKSFARINKIIDIPNLIDIQKRSYDAFLQMDVPPEKRKNTGLQGVFKSVFPIRDFNESASLEFVSYHLEKPKYDVDECHQRGMTYAAPMKVVIRLVVYWDKDPETGARAIRDVKEQEVYFGEIPLMTVNGTFIINGTERVVVSQLHRSPGAFFEDDKGKTHPSGKKLFSARIIPYRGSWIDFEFDHKDLLYVRIDRRRKMFATVLLRALGYGVEELLDYFYEKETIVILGKDKYAKKVNYDLLMGQRATRDIRDPENKSVLVAKNSKFHQAAITRMKKAGIDELPAAAEEIIGLVSAVDVVDPETGEVLLESNEEISAEKLDTLREKGVKEVVTLFIDNLNVGPYLRHTLAMDKLNSTEEAIMEIYRRMRPGDPPDIDTATKFFNNLFFNAERYDLSPVGRLKLNYKFNLNEPLESTVLTKRDIFEVVKHLIELKNGRGSADDIDHLGNRRVRAVGELLENQYRVGLVRMERAIKERMSLQEIETLMPHDLINAKPVTAVVKEFFGASQLSQFMDQTNPLSEVTHKRRLSALGPGGLTRERAGFEVRDVHPTHYGRICPIETPEGPNIGLIASLSTYANVTEYGFVETPYRKVENGKVSGRVDYYSALQEENQVIAQANAPFGRDGKFTEGSVAARVKGDFQMAPAEEVTLMDVSPNQLVSVAASLIPFLEHDDANRALMGSNMQRQAVPLIRTEAPLIGTGIEDIVARDSGVCVLARRGGKVESVDASRIVIRVNPGEVDDTDPHTNEVDIYNLTKYQRSNQNTCLNQKPIVQVGAEVKKGDILADGTSTERGELALGRNVVVAFMPWNGYNFEDSILISERIVKEDVFTSIHIEEFECVARDTKLGKEETTRDIPNVGEEALANLDESGIIRIGAEVKPGDILVGKITPKGETQLSPEEKLLRAIFGEKAGDVRDTSLRVPPGVEGIVIDAKVFSRKGVDKDERTEEIERREEARLLKDRDEEIQIIERSAAQKARRLLTGHKTLQKVMDGSKQILAKGVPLTAEALANIPEKNLVDIIVDNDEAQAKAKNILDTMQDQVEMVKAVFADKIARVKRGDELAPGVIKMIRVSVATKRKLQVGDKMAGRHGNKGVVSRILPMEDLPYLADGTPVDVVLNPLGVPSRMNVGQILEAHLGWAAHGLGQALGDAVERARDPKTLRQTLKHIFDSPDMAKKIDALDDAQVIEYCRQRKAGVHFATPVFDGAREEDIHRNLEICGRSTRAQTLLFDGRTGEPFDRDVTVGVMYMLKLHHLVDDKIHARSIGPYSLVTQQPLGGKAQFGGQRLGEMEVWAMEAYGAAYSLQEFLTVKSDDVAGRTRVYEAIVRGENVLECGVPESFNVLVKEMQSLALDVDLLERKPEPRSRALPS